MARNRTPTSILEAKGTFISHPGRQRPDEPTPDAPIGPPPSEMSKDEKKQWKRLVSQIPPGVLFESDRLMFAVLVRLATRFYAGEQLKGVEVNQMISLSSRFAMTPADRSKVSVEKPKQSSLSAFLAKRSA